MVVPCLLIRSYAPSIMLEDFYYEFILDPLRRTVSRVTPSVIVNTEPNISLLITLVTIIGVLYMVGYTFRAHWLLALLVPAMFVDIPSFTVSSGSSVWDLLLTLSVTVPLHLVLLLRKVILLILVPVSCLLIIRPKLLYSVLLVYYAPLLHVLVTGSFDKMLVVLGTVTFALVKFRP